MNSTYNYDERKGLLRQCKRSPHDKFIEHDDRIPFDVEEIETWSEDNSWFGAFLSSFE